MKSITQFNQEAQRGQKGDGRLADIKANDCDFQADVPSPTPTVAAGGKGATPEKPPASTAPTLEDPFDPQRLRLSQDFAADLGVKKILLTVPVRKPDRQTFFRVHGDPAYCLETAVLDVKEDRETYLVDPRLRADLTTEIVPKALFTAITRQGVVILLPVRMPGSDGRLDEWNRSLIEAVERAKGKWLRISANMHLGAYDIFEATANLPEPDWPGVPFQELLRLAFRDRFINTPDHPVIRKLRGEV